MLRYFSSRSAQCFSSRSTPRFFSTVRGLVSSDQRWLFDNGSGLKSCLRAASEVGVSECDAVIFASKADVASSNIIPSISKFSHLRLRNLILVTSTNRTERIALPCANLLVDLLTGRREMISQLENKSKLSELPTYKLLLGPSTPFTKDVFPRAAATLDVQPVTDIIRVKDSKTFVRPMYAGAVQATVSLVDSEAVKILTIRTAAFPPIDESSNGEQSVDVVEVDLDCLKKDYDCAVTSVNTSTSVRPSLSSASVVVSGGRALGERRKFDELLEPLANKLKAAIGATRAAVDADMANNELQVGQTGQIVAPDLYFAIGISGAVQHIAGIKDSKLIVAINKDKDAPIFQMSDYGLVGDIFEIVPELTEKLPQQ